MELKLNNVLNCYPWLTHAMKIGWDGKWVGKDEKNRCIMKPPHRLT
jgi:hypothetical protein